MAAGDIALQILIQALDQASPVIASVAASLDTLAPSVAAVNTAMASADTSLAAVDASAAAASSAVAEVGASTAQAATTATVYAGSLDQTVGSLGDVNGAASAASAGFGQVGLEAALASVGAEDAATAVESLSSMMQTAQGTASTLAAAFGEDYAALNGAAAAAGPVVSSFGEMSGSMEAAQSGLGGVGIEAELASVGVGSLGDVMQTSQGIAATLAQTFGADYASLNAAAGAAAPVVSSFGEMSGAMEAAQAGFGGVGVDATLASVGMGGAAASAEDLGKKLPNEQTRASGYQMMMYAAIVSMVAGAFIGLGMQAQTQLAIVAGLTGSSSAQMAQYTSALEGMSTQFGVTMANMAQGLYYVVSAGFKGVDALNVLRVATEAAVASGTQEKQVSDLLTGTLNAYGVSASQAAHYSDVLIAAVTYGKQTFSDLATSFGMAAVTGAGYHVSLVEMAAAEATLTDMTIPAHRAVMDLDFAVRAVMGSTDAQATKAEKLGLSFNKAAYNSMDFYQRLQYLHQIAGSNVDDFTKLVGGAAGYGAAQALLTNHGKLYNQILQEIGHSSGRTASAFQTAEQTMAAAGDHLKAVLSVLSYQFVQMISPIVIPIMHAITGALDWLTKHAEVARIVLFTLAGVVSGILVVALVALVGFFAEAAQPIGLLMIALGGLRGLLLGLAPFLQQDTVAADLLKVALLALAIAGIAYLITMLPAIITGFIGLAVAAWTAAAGVIAATWPFLAIGAAIALLIMGLKLMYDHWTGFHNLVNASIAGLRNLWDWLVNKVGAGFSALGTWIHGTVVPALKVMWDWLVNKVGAAFSALGTFVNAAKGPIGAFFSWLGTIANLERIGWGMIFGKVGEILNAVKPTVGAFFSWLGTGAHTAATVMGNIFSALGNAVNAVKPLLSFVGQEFSGLGKTVQGALKDVQSGPLAGLGKAFGDLGKALSGVGPAWQGLKNALQPVQAEFSALWKTIQSVIAQLGPQFHNMLNSIGQAVKPVGDALKGLWNALQPVIAQLGPQFHNMLNSIGQAVKPVGDALKGLWNALAGVGPAFGPILAQLGPQLKSLWNSIVDAAKPLGPMFSQIGTQARNLWNAIGPTLLPNLNVLAGIFKLLAGIIGGILVIALGLAVSALVGFVTIIVGVITGIVKIITGIIIFFTGLVKTISGVVSFIVDLVTGHFDKLGGDLGKIWDGIKTMALGLWTAIQGAWQATIGAILSGVGAFIHTVIQFFTNLFNTLVGHSIIPDMVNAIVNWFKNLVSWVVNLVSGWVHNVINWVLNLKDQVIAHVILLWTLARMYFQMYSMYIQALIQQWVARIISWVLNLRNQVIAHVLALWNLVKAYFQVYSTYALALVMQMVLGIINWWNSLIGRAQGIFNSVKSTIMGILSGIVSSAFSAGANIVQGVINGIGSMLGNLGNAAQNIANTVASFLPHSPAEKGPLSKLHTFMPGMIDTLTKGIYAGVPQMERAMTALVKPISANANGSFSLSTAHSQSFALTGNQPIVVQVQPVAANIMVDGKKVGKSTLNYATREVHIQGNYRNG